MSLDLERQVSELMEHPPPPELKAHVLGLVKEEMDEASRSLTVLPAEPTRTRTWAYPALAIAAALLIMVAIDPEDLPGPGSTTPDPSAEVTDLSPSQTDGVQSPTESSTMLGEGDVEGMTQKGAGSMLPSVEMKMSVVSEGTRSRFEVSRAYEVGDQVYFRAEVGAEATLALIRVTATGAAPVMEQGLPWTMTASAGTADLRLKSGELLTWRLDEGEETAVFAILAVPVNLEADSVDWNGLVDAVDGTYDPENANGVCMALRERDLRCDAATVWVKP